jgi:hypothetical protein
MFKVAAHRRQYPSLRSSPCRLPLRIREQNHISKRIAMTVEIAQPTVAIVYLSEYRVPSCATYITDSFCQLCVQVHPTWKDRPLPAQSCPRKYLRCQGSGFPGRALQGLQPSSSLGAGTPAGFPRAPARYQSSFCRTRLGDIPGTTGVMNISRRCSSQFCCAITKWPKNVVFFDCISIT